ncbi:response regulator [Marisediminicola antarctica]|uniref:Histidine kinase n=1 Tax=Marisediminicola antarctica TaxID=674079 RepID=A0A7L5AF73_9MICO|nr:response regulator [Marisediminicola antarctica]QHO69100.1 histidine kinase [Marisediminicola antarctica]
MQDPYRVVVVEDDLDVAMYTKTVLEKRAGCIVVAVSDPSKVLEAVADFKPDVVITDIEMPGASGLDLISQIRELQPGTPVIVMTAHVSIDYAVTALRNQASEFLTKPVSSADLVAHVTRLGEESRAPRASTARQIVLAIGAHPDDVEIAVGGILAAHRAAGDEVTVLTLSKGTRQGGIRVAWKEGSAAAATIGARLILEDNPEAEIGTPELTVATIKRVVDEVKPTIVYMHSTNDRHQSHRAVHDAGVVSTEQVRMIACYQGSSATVDFHPNRFVTIDGFTDAKLAMLACFAVHDDRPAYLDPDLALATARYWSRYGHGTSCEPLEVLRESLAVS